MAREGLRHELAGAFQEALRQKDSVALHRLKVGTDSGEQCVDVTIQRLDEPGPLQGLVMIVFTNAVGPVAAKAAGRPPKPAARSPRLAELEQETPAGPWGGAGDPRRDADLAGGTPVRQRRTAIHQ